MTDSERLDYERTIEELRLAKARWQLVAEKLAGRISIAQRGDLNGIVDIIWEAYGEAHNGS